MTARIVPFAGIPFYVATIDPTKEDLRLLWKDERGRRYGSFDSVERKAVAEKKTLLLATNAGIFRPGYIPLGLYVEQGQTRIPLNRYHGGGNFFLKPNGVFYVTRQGRAGVSETEAFARQKPGPLRLATQSGPLLVNKGKIHPKFTRGSANRNWRNGVGVTKAGKVVIALSELPVNLYDFAALFRDELKCPDALYLDGGISGMRCPQIRCRHDGTGNFAGILAVLGSS
ncbi:MAG: phosphodiester glycosidase family protein [Armatimonas sp.]